MSRYDKRGELPSSEELKDMCLNVDEFYKRKIATKKNQDIFAPVPKEIS